jgi:hypothetical protein
MRRDISSAINAFRRLAAEPRFNGWPMVGEPQLGEKLPFFGQALHYKLRTPDGVEDYTSIVRHFGWVVVFGIVEHEGRPHVVTLVQWKPGVNQASWELPPGGIGKVGPDATLEFIGERTRQMYLKETGYGQGTWTYLGHVMIETGKYRGAGPDDHGLPAHMYLATDLVQLQAARHPNANEIMETLLVPLEEIPEVLSSGLFTETSAVACALKALVAYGYLRWR